MITGPALLEPAPRDEKHIIRTVQKSGMFPKNAPHMCAAYMHHFERMQANAEVRAMQERRRAMHNVRVERSRDGVPYQGEAHRTMISLTLRCCKIHVPEACC